MIAMCTRCEDVDRTAELLDALTVYTAATDGPDWEFADVVGWGLGTAYVMAMNGPEYPPVGHTYPRLER